MSRHLDYRYCTSDYRPGLRVRLRRRLDAVLVRLGLKRRPPQAVRWPDDDPRRQLLDLRAQGEKVFYDRRFAERARQRNLDRRVPPFTCAAPAAWPAPPMPWWRISTGVALASGLLILGAKVLAHAVGP